MPCRSLRWLPATCLLLSCGPALAQSPSEHWAFRSPRAPDVPSAAGAVGPIDAFVAQRLASTELAMAGPARRETLARRVFLDLIGLPPTPDEVAAFVADGRPDAFARLVDQLLARPQYGERMALRWMDLARYADTNGYSIDGGRHMWAWRDWVIDAYNRNLPFDQFVVEQLAGDLLPDATLSQRIATGFNRNHMNTHEGGTIAEEYRVAYVADRVKTTATAFMGLTLGCAQCHDHKYDPFSQKDYYRFFAYFNTITDKGNDGDGGRNSVPFLPVHDDEQLRLLSKLRDELTQCERKLLEPDEALDAARRAWQRDRRAKPASTPDLGGWWSAGPYQAANADEAFAKNHVPLTSVDTDAIADDGSRVWQERTDLTDANIHTLRGRRSAYYFYRRIIAADATSVRWSFGADDAIRVWCNGAPIVDDNRRGAVAADQDLRTVDLREGDNELLVKIVNDGGPGGFYFRQLEAGLPPDVLAALAVEPSACSETEQRVLAGYYRRIAPSLDGLRQREATLRSTIAKIEASPITTVMVMQEMAKPRATHVLGRGRYDLPLARVEPGTPDALPPMPAGAPRNRLGLARWLVQPDHPLTARVAVNGLWQMLFGIGLVRTSEDFGTQGEAPSHPELLDWLAVEFVASGWDVKAMLRRIVLSDAYQRASNVGDAGLRRFDPDNRLLARGPSFRLAAELIRDQALAVSGLLNLQLGGPSARPYQPDGLWREMSHFGSTPATEQVYRQDHGAQLYRRSLYTIWKRTVPPPSMVAFDAPNRELCSARRGRTNTPLQALVLLHETGFVEAARKMGARMLEASEELDERLRFGFRLVTSRAPSKPEMAVLRRAHAREFDRFRASPKLCDALLSVGESPRASGLDPIEHAALAEVARLLLNLSETVTRG
ncbi:MAG: DUF1549 and DUF1553 domain-containing protein [Planctomycetota bacterium]